MRTRHLPAALMIGGLSLMLATFIFLVPALPRLTSTNLHYQRSLGNNALRTPAGRRGSTGRLTNSVVDISGMFSPGPGISLESKDIDMKSFETRNFAPPLAQKVCNSLSISFQEPHAKEAMPKCESESQLSLAALRDYIGSFVSTVTNDLTCCLAVTIRQGC